MLACQEPFDGECPRTNERGSDETAGLIERTSLITAKVCLVATTG
jgi:hypothetical protein